MSGRLFDNVLARWLGRVVLNEDHWVFDYRLDRSAALERLNSFTAPPPSGAGWTIPPGIGFYGRVEGDRVRLRAAGRPIWLRLGFNHFTFEGRFAEREAGCRLQGYFGMPWLLRAFMLSFSYLFLGLLAIVGIYEATLLIRGGVATGPEWYKLIKPSLFLAGIFAVAFVVTSVTKLMSLHYRRRLYVLLSGLDA